MDFFGDFGLRDTLLKPIEIDMDKLHRKFSALNVDFDSPSLNFLGSRKRAQRASKSGTPVKVATKWLETD